MAHILLTIVFTLAALALAFFDFRGWRKNRRIWFMISLVASIMAAIGFWLFWGVGFLVLVPAALLFALGTLFKKKQASSQ